MNPSIFSNHTFSRPRVFTLTNQRSHRRPNRAPERDDLHLLKIPHLPFTVLVTLDPLPHRLLALGLDQHTAACHIRLLPVLGMCGQGRAAKYHVSGLEVRLELLQVLGPDGQALLQRVGVVWDHDEVFFLVGHG
jgi:hypothetical protein